jgi:hypothetical protein
VLLEGRLSAKSGRSYVRPGPPERHCSADVGAIWAIRIRLQLAKRARELALFNFAFNDAQGSTRVLEYAVMKKVGGTPCFQKF